MEEEDNSQSIFNQIAQYLTSIGLGNLFSIEDGKPSGWLWDQIQNGVEDVQSLLFALEQTPEFKDRFGVIFDMRDLQNKGIVTYVPNVSEVLAYEKQYVQLMTAAGVPAWFYDSYSDAHDAMRSNLSVEQVKERIDRGFGVMQEMPAEVRSAFNDLYGAEADGALLAAVLDPTKTLAQIDKAIRSAQIAGFGKRNGLEITNEQVFRYSDMPMSGAQVLQGIQAAAQLAPMTVEAMGERGLDLTTEEALSAGLGNNATDQALFEARASRRRAEQSTITGGALVGQSGVSGAAKV